MIKTQILSQNTIKSNRRLKVRDRVCVWFILFYSELIPLTRAITCLRLYLEEKN